MEEGRSSLCGFLKCAVAAARVMPHAGGKMPLECERQVKPGQALAEVDQIISKEARESVAAAADGPERSSRRPGGAAAAGRLIDPGLKEMPVGEPLEG